MYRDRSHVYMYTYTKLSIISRNGATNFVDFLANMLVSTGQTLWKTFVSPVCLLLLPLQTKNIKPMMSTKKRQTHKQNISALI